MVSSVKLKFSDKLMVSTYMTVVMKAKLRSTPIGKLFGSPRCNQEPHDICWLV